MQPKLGLTALASHDEPVDLDGHVMPALCKVLEPHIREYKHRRQKRQ